MTGGAAFTGRITNQAGTRLLVFTFSSFDLSSSASITFANTVINLVVPSLTNLDRVGSRGRTWFAIGQRSGNLGRLELSSQSSDFAKLSVRSGNSARAVALEGAVAAQNNNLQSETNQANYAGNWNVGTAPSLLDQKLINRWSALNGADGGGSVYPLGITGKWKPLHPGRIADLNISLDNQITSGHAIIVVLLKNRSTVWTKSLSSGDPGSTDNCYWSLRPADNPGVYFTSTDDLQLAISNQTGVLLSWIIEAYGHYFQ